MEQNEFYEVDGCNWFIPVDLIEENKCTKDLEVVTRESGRITFVPTIYKFRKPPEPQKVVVPKFVAEWIDRHKNNNGKKDRLSHALEHVFDDVEVGLYIKQQEGDYTETIAKAWLDGYTVEKEKLYTVEIQNPNLNAHVVLQKTGDGLVLVTVGNARWKGWESSKLTESEIKQDFAWAWQFAKEVVE